MGKWSVLHRRHTKWLSWATVLALNLLNPARPSNCKSRSAVTHYLVRQILQISKHFWKIWSYLHILWVTKLTRREMQMVFKCLQQMLGFLTSSLWMLTKCLKLLWLGSQKTKSPAVKGLDSYQGCTEIKRIKLHSTLSNNLTVGKVQLSLRSTSSSSALTFYSPRDCTSQSLELSTAFWQRASPQSFPK